jgi:NAD(P)H-flavin reductase
LSQPLAEWTGRRGYVQRHLPEFFGQRELAVYMCGSPEMVQDVRSQFTAAGFDGHQLIYERYGD